MEKRKRTIILILCCIHNTSLLYAQWTEKDSLWLQDVLSGKEQIKLNPEVLKEIEEGTLINMDIISPKEQMKSTPSEMPLAKDFTEFVKPGNAEHMPDDPWAIPPAVFMRYGMDIPLLEDKFSKAAISIPQSIRANAARPSGLSFNDLLQNFFDPSFRAKQRNRKNANAWKNYNKYP